MLKFVFWLLLLANGILFAYHEGYLNALFSDSREPARLGKQLHPERIKLLQPLSEAKPAAAAASAAASQHAASLPAAAVAQAASATASAAPAGACLEIGAFDAAEAQRIGPRLASLLPAERIVQRQVADAQRHIVAIPPLGSKELADVKAGQLKRMGITDFYVIQDPSPMQWAISLGIFKSEDMAKAHLADLVKKGVKSAKLMPYAANPPKIAFQLRNADDKAKNGLEKLKADFPNQDVHACPAT